MENTFADLLGIVATPFTWALGWMVEVLETAGALPVFLAFFMAFTVIRLIIKPLLGNGMRSDSAEIKNKEGND